MKRRKGGRTRGKKRGKGEKERREEEEESVLEVFTARVLYKRKQLCVVHYKLSTCVVLYKLPVPRHWTPKR